MKKMYIVMMVLGLACAISARPLNFWETGRTSDAVKATRSMNQQKGLYQIRFQPDTKAGSYWFGHVVNMPKPGQKIHLATIAGTKGVKDPDAYITLSVQGWGKKGYLGTHVYSSRLQASKCTADVQELRLDFTMPDPAKAGHRWNEAVSLMVTLGVTSKAEGEFNFSDTIIEY